MRRILDSEMTTPPSIGSEPPDSATGRAAAGGAGPPRVRGSDGAACGVESGRVAFAPSTDACGPVAGVPAAAVPSAARVADGLADWLAVVAPGNTLVNVTVA